MRHPVRFRHLAAVAAAAILLTVGATTARADLAPPDTCTAPGQPCMNAGPQFNGAGTCVAMTCTKQVPGPDGGTTSMTYACNRCTAGAGGATGTGGATGAGGATGTGGATGNGGATGTGGAAGDGSGGSTSQPPSKSSGCAVAPDRGDGGSLAAPMSMLVIAGLVLVAARRRNGRE